MPDENSSTEPFRIVTPSCPETLTPTDCRFGRGQVGLPEPGPVIFLPPRSIVMPDAPTTIASPGHFMSAARAIDSRTVSPHWTARGRGRADGVAAASVGRAVSAGLLGAEVGLAAAGLVAAGGGVGGPTVDGGVAALPSAAVGVGAAAAVGGAAAVAGVTVGAAGGAASGEDTAACDVAAAGDAAAGDVA